MIAGFGTTAGFSSPPPPPVVTVLAICCCLSRCFNHGGLLLSSSAPLVTTADGLEAVGGLGSLVDSSVSAFRFTQGGTGAPPSSLATPSSLFPSFCGGGGTFGLRSCLAQGATCASSSFFSPILVSRSMMAELLPVLCLALFIISDISIPPPPPPLFLVGGGALFGLAGFIVEAFGFPGGFWKLLVGGGRDSVVAVDRFGRGGASEAGRGGALLCAGLGMDGIGVEGIGGGDIGASL